jgi:hypothetical protein
MTKVTKVTRDMEMTVVSEKFLALGYGEPS